MKKSFKDNNPAMEYITQPEAKPEIKNTKKVAETKTKRYNLILKPSAAENIAKIATMERISINELINRLITDYTEANQEKIEQYNKTFEER